MKVYTLPFLALLLLWFLGSDARSLVSAAFAVLLPFLLFYPYQHKRNKHL